MRICVKFGVWVLQGVCCEVLGGVVGGWKWFKWLRGQCVRRFSGLGGLVGSWVSVQWENWDTLMEGGSTNKWGILFAEVVEVVEFARVCGECRIRSPLSRGGRSKWKAMSG